MEIEGMLDAINDPTWGTGVFNKRLMLVAVKRSGEITNAEKHALLSEAWKNATDHGTMSLMGVDNAGRGLLLIFDVYVVKQLSVLKRLRHMARVIKTAVTGNVNVSPGVRVVVIK